MVEHVQELFLFTIMQVDGDEYYHSGSDVSDVSEILEPHIEDIRTRKNVFVKKVKEDCNQNHNIIIVFFLVLRSTKVTSRNIELFGEKIKHLKIGCNQFVIIKVEHL